MKIKSHSIDTVYFVHDIEEFMLKETISQDEVISITQSSGFTTLWYWSW